MSVLTRVIAGNVRQAPVPIEIRVRDAAGSPLDEVLVEVRNFRGPDRTDFSKAQGNVVRFDVPVERLDRDAAKQLQVNVKVRRRGFGPVTLTGDFVADEVSTVRAVTPGKLERFDFQLEPGGILNRFEGKVLATRSLRKPDKTLPGLDDHVFPAGSNTVLVRGSRVELAARTLRTEGGSGNAIPFFDVQPASGETNQPTPGAISNRRFEGGAAKATLSSSMTGSFVVTCDLGDQRLTWNVTFVEVTIVNSSAVAPATSFNLVKGKPTKIGRDRDSLILPSGKFDRALDDKRKNFDPSAPAWKAEVDVELIGGGPGKSQGVGKLRVGYLQNGVLPHETRAFYRNRTLTNTFKGGRENFSRREKIQFPVLDTLEPVERNLIPAEISEFPLLSLGGSRVQPIFILQKVMISVTPNQSAAKRHLSMLDTPSEVCIEDLSSRVDPVPDRLRIVEGSSRYRAAVASVSVDCPEAIVVHGVAEWEVPFNGDVDIDGLLFTPLRSTRAIDATFRIAPNGGADAAAQGFEVAGPVLNAHGELGLEEIWGA